MPALECRHSSSEEDILSTDDLDSTGDELDDGDDNYEEYAVTFDLPGNARLSASLCSTLLCALCVLILWTPQNFTQHAVFPQDFPKFPQTLSKYPNSKSYLSITIHQNGEILFLKAHFMAFHLIYWTLILLYVLFGAAMARLGKYRTGGNCRIGV